MYGNPAFAPAYASPAAASYGMAPYAAYGTTVFGVDPPKETFMDKSKKFLDDKTVGVQNKFWLGGAVLGGVLWYGASAGWFR